MNQTGMVKKHVLDRG